MDRQRIGVAGCGVISDIYLKNLTTTFRSVEVVAVADVFAERSAEKSLAYNVRAMSFEELLEDAGIDVILNLTAPSQHFPVSMRALEHGKHVYSEKTLAANREDARKLLRLAREKGLRVGCAPDTFLGGGLQTAIKAVRDGWIGRPLSATMFCTSHGVESWHANPGFYYTREVGPVFDMGPYYFTALAALLGPVARVSAVSSRASDTRLITSQPLAGTRIPVDTDTHVAGMAEMESGVLVNLMFSFDIWSANLPYIEIYGTEGTISLGNPDYFAGPVRLRGRHEDAFRELPILFPYVDNGRGLGLAQMCHAIQTGTECAASGDLAFHVLDIICGVTESCALGKAVVCDSSVGPVPLLKDMVESADALEYPPS